MVVALVGGQREAGAPEVGALARGERHDVVVEAGDPHASRPRVVEVGHQLHQLRDGVARGAAHVAGVGLAFRGVEHEMESDEPAQAGQRSWPLPVQPGRIGDDDGMRSLAGGQAAQHRLQRRRSDLFLHLPQQADTDGHARLARRPHPEEGGQGRTLVVRGAAAEVAAAAPHETEGIGPPAFGLAVGGLHVEMVVEDDGGRAAGGGEVAHDERMAAGAPHARPASGRAHEVGGEGGAAPHVGAMRGMGGNRRDLDERAQGALVFGPDSFSKLIEGGAAKENHPRIMPRSRRSHARVDTVGHGLP